MHALVAPRRRGQRRRVRLVGPDGLGRQRAAPLTIDEAQIYALGMEISQHMQRLFPIEYAAGVAHRPLSFPQILLVGEAFLGLVDNRLFRLSEWMASEITPARDPLALLASEPTIERDEAWATLVDFSYALQVPNAGCYGLGVQSAVDGGEVAREYSLLTLAIWQLFRSTSYAIGYDVFDLAENALPTAQEQLLERLPPLARLSADAVEALLETFTLPERRFGAQAGMLVAYAFGRTGNPLADYTDEEVAEIFEGQSEDDWSAALQIAQNAQEALAISLDYADWERAVAIDPERELRYLSDALHTAASGAPAPWQERPTSPYLIDLLPDEDPDDEEAIED